jgi:hypothetical protein
VGGPLGASRRLVRVSLETSHRSLKVKHECRGALLVCCRSVALHADANSRACCPLFSGPTLQMATLSTSVSRTDVWPSGSTGDADRGRRPAALLLSPRPNVSRETPSRRRTRPPDRVPGTKHEERTISSTDHSRRWSREERAFETPNDADRRVADSSRVAAPVTGG